MRPDIEQIYRAELAEMAAELPTEALAEWARRGRADVVLAMIQAGHSPDKPSRATRETALTAAVGAGQREIVRLLLERGANPNAHHAREPSALGIACRRGDLPAARLLLERGADPTELFEQYGERRTPMHSAARSGDLAILELLLAHGASANPQPFGTTPLMSAVEENRPRAVRWLIDHGAALDAIDQLQRSALMLAMRRRCRECVPPLLAAGAALDLRDSDGKTAIMHAKSEGLAHEVALLREAGASTEGLDQISSVHQVDPGEDDLLAIPITAVWLSRMGEPGRSQGGPAPQATPAEALDRGDIAATRALIRAGQLALEQAQIEGETPLRYAVAHGDRELARVLVAARAQIVGGYQPQRTPLALAEQRGDLAMVRLLLEGLLADGASQLGLRPISRWPYTHDLIILPASPFSSQIQVWQSSDSDPRTLFSIGFELDYSANADFGTLLAAWNAQLAPHGYTVIESAPHTSGNNREIMCNNSLHRRETLQHTPG